jgi:enterobactin synthetase component D
MNRFLHSQHSILVPAPGAILRASPDLPFIELHPGQLPGLPQRHPYVLARFQRAMFTSSLYAQHGIAMPDAIRTSGPGRQAEFLAGRMCAQAVLQVHGIDAWLVGIGAHRQPLWPENILGSITHSHGYAAAAACPGAGLFGIGIDIEAIVGAAAREALLQVVVSQREIACLRQAAGALDFDTLLTLVFSAKESFFKAAFAQLGRYIEFDVLELFHVDLVASVLSFRCVQTLSAHLAQGQICHAHYLFLDGAVLTAVVLAHVRSGPAVRNSSDLAEKNAVK